MSGLYDTVCTYLSVYQTTAVRAWNHLTPQQYASLLLSVAGIGWLAMRGGPK